MRTKKRRGNITLLALFVLLASALIGVLVALFMKYFLRYSDDVLSYEKVHYLAKAGTELGLALVNSRGPGLSFDNTELIDKLCKSNFTCPHQVEEGKECMFSACFSLKIEGLARGIKRCSSEQNTQIKAKHFLAIPLFQDS